MEHAWGWQYHPIAHDPSIFRNSYGTIETFIYVARDGGKTYTLIDPGRAHSVDAASVDLRSFPTGIDFAASEPISA